MGLRVGLYSSESLTNPVGTWAISGEALRLGKVGVLGALVKATVSRMLPLATPKPL